MIVLEDYYNECLNVVEKIQVMTKRKKNPVRFHSYENFKRLTELARAKFCDKFP